MSNDILESMFSDFIENNIIGLSDSATKELFTDVQFFFKYCSEVSYVNIDLTKIDSAQEEIWAKFHYWNEKYNYYMNGKGHYTDRSMLVHDIAVYLYPLFDSDWMPEDVKGLSLLFGLLRELEDTPVKDRFPEKKYRLRWINNKDGSSKYIDRGSNGNWDMWGVKNSVKTFTESEIEQLKKDYPRFASVIDVMKEPAEEKE